MAYKKKKKFSPNEIEQRRKDAIRIRQEALIVKKEAIEILKKQRTERAPGDEITHDKNGKIIPGARLPGSGRPKEYFSLKSILKNMLQEIEPKNQRTYAELLVRKIVKKAIIEDGDFQQKLIWNYLEGMPKQTLEGNVDIKTALVTFIGGAMQTEQHLMPKEQEQLESGEEKKQIEDGTS